MQPATPPKSSPGWAEPSSRKSPTAPQMSMHEKHTGPPTATPSLSMAAAAEKSPMARAAPPRKTKSAAAGCWLSAASAGKKRSPMHRQARKAQQVCTATMTTPKGCAGAPENLAQIGQWPQKRKLTTTSATAHAGKGMVAGQWPATRGRGKAPTATDGRRRVGRATSAEGPTPRKVATRGSVSNVLPCSGCAGSRSMESSARDVEQGRATTLRHDTPLGSSALSRSSSATAAETSGDLLPSPSSLSRRTSLPCASTAAVASSGDIAGAAGSAGAAAAAGAAVGDGSALGCCW
eukprot:scaffold8145_cov57-Phaeocystis_antarctica.AAC.1